RRRIRRYAQDRLDLQPAHPRPLRRPLLRQGAEPAPARARGLRRRACEPRPAVAADRADEGDADSRQGRNPARHHAPPLGADPPHVPVQRHRAPGDQPALRDGGRPSHRAHAGRPPLRRGDDLSRRRGVRALGRLDEILTRRGRHEVSPLLPLLYGRGTMEMAQCPDQIWSELTSLARFFVSSPAEPDGLKRRHSRQRRISRASHSGANCAGSRALPRRNARRGHLASNVDDQEPTRTGAVSLRRSAITLSAVMRPVFGFSLGMFSIVISIEDESDLTTMRWILRVTVGSAQISSVVLSGPIPASDNATATFKLAGKPLAASRALPLKMSLGSVNLLMSMLFSMR